MRTLGLDLGTKTLGLAISDKSNQIANPLTVLHWDGENYDVLFNELDKIIETNQVDDFCLGLPKNMNNTLGFAAERSLNFKKAFEGKYKKEIHLVDERLSTTEATNYLLDADMSRKKRKKVVDSVAASIILDTYLRGKEN